MPRPSPSHSPPAHHRLPRAAGALLLAALPLLSAARLAAEEWPTCAHDFARSGVTTERLAWPLRAAWTHRAAAPRPAWPGPARADLYSKIHDLSPRITYDRAPHVAVAGGRVYFASSADDQLHCLELAGGDELWTAFAEAPLRPVPTVAAGRVYFASDDGHVYCARADDGAPVWQTRIHPRDTRLAGNGRVIAVGAVRCGLVVDDGKVYAAAGVAPREGVYLAALRADDGEALWKTPIDDLPAQGHLLASAARLYVTSGRANPIVFDRASGKRLRTLAGAGGAYALLRGDTLIFGPGKREQLAVVPEGGREQLASFAGNQLLVAGRMFYVQATGKLRALDGERHLELVRERADLAKRQKALAARLKRLGGDAASAAGRQVAAELAEVTTRLAAAAAGQKKCIAWEVPCPLPNALVLAGDTLVAGGDGRVAAFRAADGAPLWEAAVEGKAYGLAVASGRLLVSTDRGVIHCFGAETSR